MPIPLLGYDLGCLINPSSDRGNVDVGESPMETDCRRFTSCIEPILLVTDLIIFVDSQ